MDTQIFNFLSKFLITMTIFTRDQFLSIVFFFFNKKIILKTQKKKKKSFYYLFIPQFSIILYNI